MRVSEVQIHFAPPASPVLRSSPGPAGNSRAHASSMRERFVVLASDLSSYITGEVVSISGGTVVVP
jgi:hypothetical protein